MSASLSVTFNAVAALVLLVIDLGLGVADAAHSSNQVVARKASAGTDGGVPDFIGLARSVADAVSFIIDLSRRANSARISNKIVSSFALADSVFPLFEGIAG